MHLEPAHQPARPRVHGAIQGSVYVARASVAARGRLARVPGPRETTASTMWQEKAGGVLAAPSAVELERPEVVRPRATSSGVPPKRRRRP